MSTPFLHPGKNCWRTATAERVGFILDGELYFRAFREAVLQAERFVGVLAWDVHSRVLLERDGETHDGYPAPLGEFLEAVLEAKPELHIHFLTWDFSVIYAAEREWQLFSKTFHRPHPRLHFQQDDHLPMSASHHQKVVVVDDRVAFAGGLDLSIWRWDTTAHHLDDKRRCDPTGKPYDPYHDTQMAVSGDAARMLGDLFRTRWKDAVQQSLDPLPPASSETPWPPSVGVDLEDVTVGVARTGPRHDPHPAVREVLQLHLDVIKAAENYLYLENQYLSSPELQEALAARLREPDGPEVVLVLTANTDGWMEESTMGVLRNRLLELLGEADEHDRFRVYYPQVTTDSGSSTQIYVHSKVFIVDDRIAKVGSSNLSNRSMKVDTECDLVVSFEAPHEGIRQFRDRLFASYFARDSNEIRETFDQNQSFIGGVESLLSDRGHSLRAMPFGCDNDLQRKLADSRILDPDEPLDPGYWLQETVAGHERASVLKRITYITLGILAILGMALLLKWGWGNVFSQEMATEYLERIQASTWSPLILASVFYVGGLIGVPLNLILVAAAVVLGPFIALGCGIVGAQLSAMTTFGLGRWLGKPMVAKLAHENVDELSRRIGRHGLISVILVRLLPIAPFIITNLLAGASHLRFSVFNWGSLMGMAPGMLGVVLVTDRVDAAIRNPGPVTFLLLGLVVASIAGVVFFIRKKLTAIQASTTA